MKRSGWRKPWGSGSKRTKRMDLPSGIHRGMVGSLPSRVRRVWRRFLATGVVRTAGTSSGSRFRASSAAPATPSRPPRPARSRRRPVRRARPASRGRSRGARRRGRPPGCRRSRRGPAERALALRRLEQPLGLQGPPGHLGAEAVVEVGGGVAEDPSKASSKLRAVRAVIRAQRFLRLPGPAFSSSHSR